MKRTVKAYCYPTPYGLETTPPPKGYTHSRLLIFRSREWARVEGYGDAKPCVITYDDGAKLRARRKK